MKTSHIIAQAAALYSLAAAQDAYLWTMDNGDGASQADQVSSELAAAILAQRRGMTNDRYVTDLGKESLLVLNHYGGYQAPLFGKSNIAAKVFITITDLHNSGASTKPKPDLRIEKASHDLLSALKARKDVNGLCEYEFSVGTKHATRVMYSYTTEEPSCLSMQQVGELPAMAKILSVVPTAKTLKSGMGALVHELSGLSASDNIESAILVLPDVSKLSKTKSSRRSAAKEEPLDLPSSSASSEVGSGGSLSSVAASNKTHKLPSVIPVCFSSNETCTKDTNSCSGHGPCYKAHNGCYKCKCGTTVVRVNEDGSKKTVQWGGNACQKKDISVPFVMFASLGIVLTSLVAGGIGLLYSMGSQDLPSVLGAGVAGPRAQK